METNQAYMDFSLLTEQNQLIGSVNRNFAGFGREVFTDTGVYVLHMDATSVATELRHLISRTAVGRPYRSDKAEISKGNVMESRLSLLRKRSDPRRKSCNVSCCCERGF